MYDSDQKVLYLTPFSSSRLIYKPNTFDGRFTSSLRTHIELMVACMRITIIGGGGVSTLQLLLLMRGLSICPRVILALRNTLQLDVLILTDKQSPNRDKGVVEIFHTDYECFNSGYKKIQICRIRIKCEIKPDKSELLGSLLERNF